MRKKLDKYDRAALKRKAARKAMTARLGRIVDDLRLLADTMGADQPDRDAGGLRIDNNALTLVESAHYSLRKVRSRADYIR